MIAKAHNLCVWFSVRTHRHEEPQPGGIPPQLDSIDDLFDVVIQLQPEGKNIHVRVIKGQAADSKMPELNLDPATMLMVSKPE